MSGLYSKQSGAQEPKDSGILLNFVFEWNINICEPIYSNKYYIRSNRGKNIKLFSDYYLIKSKELLIENIEIYGLILNLITENQTKYYFYNEFKKVFNKNCYDSKAIRFMSNIIMQSVIKILEDNKILN